MSAADSPSALRFMRSERSLRRVSKRFGRIGRFVVERLLWHEGDWSTFSQGVIAALGEFSREGVNACIRRLREAGIVEHDKLLGPDGGQGVDRYRLRLVALRDFLNGLRDFYRDAMAKLAAEKDRQKRARRAYVERLRCGLGRFVSPPPVKSVHGVSKHQENKTEQGRLAAALRSAKASGVSWYEAAQVVMRDHPGASLGDLLDLVPQEG